MIENTSNFTSIINKFGQKNILVLGDAMLDTYLYGISHRICREAPVPVVEMESQTYTGGGAANTAINVAKLGASTTFLSVIGDDVEGKLLLQTLKQHNIRTEEIIVDLTRKTLSKTRINANGQLLLRCDNGTTKEIREVTESRLINKLIDAFTTADAVIISDYGYGLLTERILTALDKLQRAIPKMIVIDSKYLDRYAFLAPTVVKPNYQETLQLLGITKSVYCGKRSSQIVELKEQLFEKTNAHIVTVTLDAEGSLVFDRLGKVYHIDTFPVENSRAAGAGDTYIATYTLAFLTSGSAAISAEIASRACEIILQKNGTAYTSQTELLQTFVANKKFLSSYDEIEKIVTFCKKNKKKIVFTNGCFDILHSGHVHYLQNAKELGDILIVGINTDASVKKLKGAQRPINILMDRIQVLSGLSSIDYIIPFEEDMPIKLIRHIVPDIYVKGGDYTSETLPEALTVESLGGRVEIIPLVIDKSTTNIIRKITTSHKLSVKI